MFKDRTSNCRPMACFLRTKNNETSSILTPSLTPAPSARPGRAHRDREKAPAPPQALVAYNVPIWLCDAALRDFLSTNGFAVDTLTRSTWNPGRMSTAAWKLQGPHLPQTSVILHDAQKNTSITIIPLKEFNDLKRDSMEARKRQQPAGKTTYARATRTDK